MVAAAYTEGEVAGVEREILALSRETREYIEHVVGNGFMRIQQAATINPARVSEEIDRVMNELTAAGFWELRRLRGR